MAETTISDAVKVKQWEEKAHAAYIRSNRFKPYMGADENAIIQMKEDLTNKKGTNINITLLGALDDSTGPNDGSTDLVGNEKAQPNEGHSITTKVVRDATLVNFEEAKSSPIDIRNAGKAALKKLQMRYLRNDIITALGSVDGVAYSTATAGQKNTWHDNNSDRIVYGGDISNFVASDHAASLLNVAGTDKLTRSVVSKYKRVAQKAKVANSDGIPPVSYGDDQETFVMFVGSEPFRDLRKDMEDSGTWANARERAKTNPLFSGPTSVEWDGVIVREIPEIDTIAGVGAGDINVAPVFLCGAQALGAAWAQRTKSTMRKEDDYGFRFGVGFQEMRKIEKLQYGQGSGSAVDWAVMTGFVAGVPDA